MMMMLMLIAVIWLGCYCARASVTWPVNSAATLLDAILHATAGDNVELEPGDYVFRSQSPDIPAVRLDRPLSIRSRDPRRRAVLRGDSVAVLISITSPGVTLSDLVVGKQASGGDERTIDVYIASGTQKAPASTSILYPNVAADTPAILSRGEILSARGIQTAGVTTNGDAVSGGGDLMRAISGVSLINVDFSRSLSGTNVAFARGSYADITVQQCVFGRENAPYINALVSVSDAQFANLNVHRNMFVGDAHVLIGSTALTADALGLNFWPSGGARAQVYIGSQKRVPETYCRDSECTQLGPVIDADQPTRVFATLAGAFEARVQRIRVTDDIVLESGTPSIVRTPDTTIEGGEGCSGAPLITIYPGSPIVAAGAGSLIGVRNLRIAMEDERCAAFIFTDGLVSSLPLTVAKSLQPLINSIDVAEKQDVYSVALFDGVSVLGDGSNDQAAVVLNIGGWHLELQDTLIVHVQYGVLAHRGSVVALDSTFVSCQRSAVYVETVTHQAGARVSGATFIRCTNAIEVGGAAPLSALIEFSVKCSTFLFNTARLPIISRDCAKKPAACAAAVRYNTIISDLPEHVPGALDEAELRMLRQGANHAEHGRTLEQYVYAGAPKHFSLEDDQGRLSWVSGALIADQNSAGATFLVASYVPLRSECLVASESETVDSAQAAVVSDVLELRSDSLLHQCTSVGVRFRIADAKTLPDSLAVYGVSGLGTQHTAWERMLASTERNSQNEVTLESTLATHDATQRHQHRIVVVALSLLPDALNAALASGAALVSDTPERAAAKRLCVACNGATITPRVLDELCGGSTDNVRKSFDDAYEELHMGVGSGAPRHEPVSLLVVGECNLERRCTASLDQNEHIEGLSESSRGTLRRKSQSQCSAQTPLIEFTPRAAKSTLRYMNVKAQKQQQCLVHVTPSTAQLGPTVAYSTLDGGICVDGRSGGRYINNDISGDVVLTLSEQPNGPNAHATAVLVEANLFMQGGLRVHGGGGNAEEVRIDRNRFSTSAGGIVLEGQSATVRAINNENVAQLVSSGVDNKLTAIDNTFTIGALIFLHDGDTLNGGVEKVALSGADIKLSGRPRLLNAKLNTQSKLRIDTSAPTSAILRNVVFQSIGETLNNGLACSGFEINTSGIDLAHSLIFTDASGSNAVLTPSEQQTIASDPTAYWHAEDGKLEHCANGAVDRSGQCGCPGEITTRKPKVQAVTEQPPRTFPQLPTQDDLFQPLQTNSVTSSSTLLIVLAIVGVVVFICILLACAVVLFSRASTASIVVSNASMASRAHAHQKNLHSEPIAVDPERTSILSALHLRARKAIATSE